MSGLSPEELRELRRVHVLTSRKVDSLFAGDYRSALRGQGMEFDEVRAYTPGDDVRYIDWNVTARTGEPFIKVFQEERQLTVMLVVDVSGSTKVGSGGRDGRTDRRLQIARIAGSLAYAGIRNRDSVGLITFSDQIETYLSPRRTRGHVWRVIQSIFEAEGEQHGTNLAEALQYAGRMQRRRSVIVVISDFIDAGDWERALGVISQRHQVHAIAVSDPLDTALPNLGLIELFDAETGDTMLVDSSAYRPEQSGDLLKRLRRKGAHAVQISTNEDPFHAMALHFHAMGRRR